MKFNVIKRHLNQVCETECDMKQQKESNIEVKPE